MASKKRQPKLIIPGRHAYACDWPTLRQGIIEILLDNPDIASYHKRMVETLLRATCNTYQSYCSYHKNMNSLDTSDTIFDIDHHLSYDMLRERRDYVIYDLLCQIYEPSYLGDLNSAFGRLAAVEQASISEDLSRGLKELNAFKRDQLLYGAKKWVFPVEDLINTFAAVAPEYFDLICGYAV